MDDTKRVADVSVVIATFNRASLVGESIQSVLDQTLAPREVIVVDDGSTDGTEDVLSPLIASGAIRYIRLSVNRGQAAAFNEGIRAASGRYVAINSSDDLWLPEKLATQLSQLESHPEAALAYANVLNWDPDTGQRWLRVQLRLPEGDVYDELAFRRIFMSWITVMVRREALEEAGLFDEELRRHEDRDLSVRLAALYRVVATQSPLAVVRLHGSSHPKDPVDTFAYAEWIRFERRVVDKIVAANAGRRLWTRRLRARYAYVWGRGWISRGERAEALRALLRAVVLWPISVKAWVFLPRALFVHKKKELPGG